MKKLIYRYLNEIYYWKDINVKFKSDDKLASVRDISKDLTLVFGLTKKETKWYLKGWYKKTNKSFQFKKAWNYAWQNIYVGAGVRKIKATWTADMAYELNSYHGIDTEAELTRMFSEEIDRQIVEGIMRQYEETNP